MNKETKKRDHLIRIERVVQQQWKEANAFEARVPDNKAEPKFFGNFPYPYMNGVLHLGHAFTLAKVEFASRFQRLLGKNVLFPFAFHCTGMPIAACADKLKRELLAFGCPPCFPPEDDDDPEEPAKKAKKGKIAKKKSKHKWQWQIMREMGVSAEEIPLFRNALHWLDYFPPISVDDLHSFGLSADFTRAFITTDKNPYYDSFIRWQFNTLKAKGKVKFGKRLCVFSPIDGQQCADHDRATGEGVGPQDYTLVKIKLLAPYPQSLAKFQGQDVFLPAATLRPETMYGQTNLFVLPTGKYGVYKLANGDIFVCSQRSADNMSYQDLFPVFGKPDKLGEVMGSDLLGCAVQAPLASYEKVYVLPLLTIKMNKGTGVVTSVPSDAPADWAALMDLKKKEALRKKFGITDEMVQPFDVVPIIDTPGHGDTPAATLCEQRGVKSQNDITAIEEIKDIVYKLGFNEGVMKVGVHAGMPVKDAKPLIKELMIADGTAIAYSEPEKTIISRSGGECVVALTDQWYLTYGEDQWRNTVSEHLNSNMEMYNPATLKKFQEKLAWLKEWGCSRGYGLGTKLPWDQQFVIESLSDSTIYMAYYTVAKYLQGGTKNLNGCKTGPAGIKAEDMTDDVWNYLFLNKLYPDYPKGCVIAQETLDAMRGEFEYWYPWDLRVSGKDLIGNHLTMTMYNHAAIWDQDPSKWPRGIYTNGHLMIGAEKMSKSTGNFMTMKAACEKFSADATRLALADAGDGLMDANFAPETANATILRLSKEEEWFKELQATPELLQDEPTGDGFLDASFENEMNGCINKAKVYYEEMKFHEALCSGFFDFCNARDEYRANVDGPMNRGLVMRWLEAMVVMISPICPHWTQHMWKLLGHDGFVLHATWPSAEEEEVELSTKMGYLRSTGNSIRSVYGKQLAKNAKKAAPLNSATITVATSYPAWQEAVLNHLSSIVSETGTMPEARALAKELSTMELLASDKKMLKKAMAFSAQVGKEYGIFGKAALATTMSFDELALLTDHTSFVTRGLGLSNVEIVVQKDCEEKNAALPGKPKVMFFNQEQN